MEKISLLLISIIFCISCGSKEQNPENFNSEDMIIRISELEIKPEHLKEYLSILKEESRASVELEPGVISIYPCT